LARTFDQAGDVRDGELSAFGRVDRPQHGRERRERIVGDLRPRVRDPREQRRLACVRQPDERRVGEQLQPELQECLFARQAGLRKPRHLTCGRGEALVATTGLSTTSDDDARAWRRQIGDQLLVLVEDLRADGNADLGRLARGAVLERAAPRLTAAGLERLARAERREVAEIRVGDEHDVAAGAPVTAVGPPFRHVLLAPEVQAAVAAATRLNADAGAVMEHRSLLGGVDFDEALLAALAERDRAGSRREDRVVAADAGSRTGTELRSALADDDHPGLHVLAGEDLHAEHLRLGVAPVARRAEPFLVCHLVLLLLRFDRGLERGDRALAVRVRAFVLERRFQLFPFPPLRFLADLRDGEVCVAPWRLGRALLFNSLLRGRFGGLRL